MNDREVSLSPEAKSRVDALDLAEVEALMTYWLRRASRQLTHAHALAEGRLDVKPYEFAALSLIVGNPGITSAQLSDALGIRRPNFVQVLRDLEDAGLVVRCLHAADGRASALHATAMGKAKVFRLSPALRQVEAQSLGLLNAREAASLLHLLRKLCNAPTRARPNAAGIGSAGAVEG